MKQTKKLISVIFITALLCAIMAGCSDSSDDPVVGTWEMTSVSAAGQEMTTAQFLEMANQTETPIITFNGDNTVDLNMLGQEGSGNWELNDDKYRVTDSTDSSLDFELKDGVLSVQQSGATLTFEKQK